MKNNSQCLLFSQKKCSFNINVDTFLVSIKWLLQTFESFCKPVGSCHNPRQRLKAETELLSALTLFGPIKSLLQADRKKPDLGGLLGREGNFKLHLGKWKFGSEL